MSQTPSDFSALMERLREGSQEAARELVERYGSAIQRAVRRRLGRTLRSQFDSLDFAQEAWGVFFSRLPDLEGMESPERLIAFLRRVAANKVIDEVRGRAASSRCGAAREAPLDAADSSVAPASTPSEELIARESWERLLTGSPERDRAVLEMKRDGCTTFEIAAALSLNERTVRRAVERALAQIDRAFTPDRAACDAAGVLEGEHSWETASPVC